ncbi:hypothetical protein [Amycolatopsis sp. NPDC051903]|uniref:hypothetical protein n=1 Tax=Amycolatopsis sp. NPDC051903 TaxID=3363936 RepID=UPI0037A03101
MVMRERAVPTVTATREMHRWTVEVTADEAIFACRASAADRAAARTLPRAWSGRGLGVSSVDVPGLAAALGEVMKTPLFHHARQAAPDVQAWAVPHVDEDEDFTYVAGPCGGAGNPVGYHPVPDFAIALSDVRGLRIRLAAHLNASPHGDFP